MLDNRTAITDNHMAEFRRVLKKNSKFRCQDPFFLINPDRLRIVDKNREHIQILYSESDQDRRNGDGHWKTIHYVNHRIHVYDSARRSLLRDDMFFIKQILPYKCEIFYETTQLQNGRRESGIFAMAFATSLAMGNKILDLTNSTQFLNLNLTFFRI